MHYFILYHSLLFAAVPRHGKRHSLVGTPPVDDVTSSYCRRSNLSTQETIVPLLFQAPFRSFAFKAALQHGRTPELHTLVLGLNPRPPTREDTGRLLLIRDFAQATLVLFKFQRHCRRRHPCHYQSSTPLPAISIRAPWSVFICECVQPQSLPS